MTGNKEILELGNIIENLIHQKGLLNNKWKDFVDGPASINDKWTIFVDLINNRLLSAFSYRISIQINGLGFDIDLADDLGLARNEAYSLLNIYSYILERYPSLDENIVKDSMLKEYWDAYRIIVC